MIIGDGPYQVGRSAHAALKVHPDLPMVAWTATCAMTMGDKMGAVTATDPDEDLELPAEPRPRRRLGWRASARLRNAGGLGDDIAEVVVSTSGGHSDRLASFNPAILTIRWTIAVVGLALAYPDFVDQQIDVIIWAGIIVGYTGLRTLVPIRYTGDTRSLLEVIAEVALMTLAVTGTGYWESPYLATLVTAVMIAGFARGFGFAVRIGVVSALAVAIPEAAQPGWSYENNAPATLQWSVILLMVALIAGYARRISGEADLQHSLTLDRLGRLADANALLFNLHRVAQTLPASLDLDEVLDSTVSRLRSLLDFDVLVILTFDETDGSWRVERRDGTRLPTTIATSALPPPLREVVSRNRLVHQSVILRDSPGLAPSMGSGIYAPLPARGVLIGLIALEHPDEHHFTPRDLELISGFVEPVALAIDNARWFARLRTVGADEERTRIARDLHDRIGQSLAYLAFELDRLVTAESKGADIGSSLERLRTDVRGVISEVRDTLYDLRTDVSDEHDIAEILEQYIARVRTRSGLEIVLHADHGPRLPLMQEREMWRIAQEALTNVERHADASRVRVLWRSNGDAAALEVADDGKGFTSGTDGRLDSYGMLGMRERASSIGATLEVLSAPGKGTRVRCYLAPPNHTATTPRS